MGDGCCGVHKVNRYERVVLPTAKLRPACPAAEPVAEADGGTGCRCAITRDVFDSRSDPSTLVGRCYNSDGYVGCPTWRRDKEHAWAQRTNRDLLDRHGNFRVPDEQDREHKFQRELLDEVQAA